MTSVSSAVHVASSASAHVSSVYGTTSVHGSTSEAHVAPHGSTPGGATHVHGGAATAAAEVSAVRESSEGWWRQEATRRTVETSTWTRTCTRESEVARYFFFFFSLQNPSAFGQTLTSSEVAPVLEASTSTATSLARSSAAKLVLSPAAAWSAAPATSLWYCASLVGFLLCGQSCLTFLLVRFQQLCGLLLLQLGKDHLTEALALFRQCKESFSSREKP